MQSRLRSKEHLSRREGVNPLDSLANLADVMLVLACGLMLSLIMSWNVDWGQNVTELEQGQELAEGKADNSEGLLGGEYAEVGTVYQDPVSGKLYMVSNDEP